MNSQNLSQGLQSFQLPGGNFSFTGIPIGGDLAMEQTLYTNLVDESGSTRGFRPEMEKCSKEIVKSLSRSPRADNLLFRYVHFSTGKREIHGFKPLRQCNVGDYDGVFDPQISGQTDLFDSTLEVSEVTRAYAENLVKERYLANAIITVTTDGCDYPGSTHGPADVRRSFEEMINGEMLESLVTILIGVNIQTDSVRRELEEFKEKAGFTQFICVEDATEKTLASIAEFISNSVSSQSQALGSGGASQSLTF